MCDKAAQCKQNHHFFSINKFLLCRKVNGVGSGGSTNAFCKLLDISLKRFCPEKY
jgi:hypothetical protein